MPYNLFIIPIIAGYFIITNSSLFKYNSQRLTRSRILLESLLIGLITVGVGFLLRTLIELSYNRIISKTLEKLNSIPFEKPTYFWTFLFSCLFAIMCFALLELVILKLYDKNTAIIWAVNRHGDELETIVKDSALNGQAILLTLKNDKVYIGFFEETPIPSKTNYLSISPILSGYRDKETKKLVVTTDYFEVVEEFMSDIEEKEGVELEKITLNTDIVIKQDEIITASIYEQNIYDKFNKLDRDKKEKRESIKVKTT